MSGRTKHLRLGTRGSMLAKMQSQQVADALVSLHPGLSVELILVKTTGDRVQDRPLHDAGGKGLFTKELEQALIDGQIDFAVHSYKDVPVTMPLVDVSSLEIVAVPVREDVRDLLITTSGIKDLKSLPKNARVGTDSLRRRCQLLVRRPDLRMESIRGNIDTRLRKLRDGQFDAIILAIAGVKRAGLFDPSVMSPLDESMVLPAAGQGALALQCRKNNHATKDILIALNDPDSFAAVKIERQVVAELEGDCHSPIAVWARKIGGQMSISAAVGARDGNPPIIRAESSQLSDLIAELRRQGVAALLKGSTGF